MPPSLFPSFSKPRRRPFSTAAPPPDPLLFSPPLLAGRHTQGDATYLSLARAHSAHPNPSLPSLLSLLSHMRRSLPRRPPFPEYLFPPFFSALARSLHPAAPALALQLFDKLLPSFGCRPTAKSLNSALNVLAARAPGLALPFFRRAVSEHGGASPNFLTFNLLIKAAVRCGEVDEGAELLREMVRRGMRADAYGYSTVIDGLCRAGRVEEAMGLLDEMQVFLFELHCIALLRCA